MRSYEIIQRQDSSKIAQSLFGQAQTKVIRTFKKCPNPPKCKHHPMFKVFKATPKWFFLKGPFLFLARHISTGKFYDCSVVTSSDLVFLLTGDAKVSALDWSPGRLPGKAKLQKFPFSSPACCCSMTRGLHERNSNGIVKNESTKNQNSAKTAQSLTKFAAEYNNPTERRDSSCNCLPKTNTDSLANTKIVEVETHF